MITSMTGFARAAGTTGPVQWVWEVRSVNGRGLDVRVRVPNGFDGPGEAARTALQKALSSLLAAAITLVFAAVNLGFGAIADSVLGQSSA
ncbi:YicC/YloC family endoribonuclease, partial [Methylobacterium sp. WL9]|uniref:YicC/YloC family endoribonuclease n=1 Tax=Methylobacterium sp. WL9 TaxID=2603898 RepID=UPI0032B2AB62